MKVEPARKIYRPKYPSFEDKNPLLFPETKPYPFSMRFINWVSTGGLASIMLLSSNAAGQTSQDSLYNPFPLENAQVPYRPVMFGTGMPERLKSKEAIVSTFPVNSWNDLVNQRVRWASKTGNFKSIKVKLIGLLVLLINLSIIFTFFGSFFGLNSFTIPLILFTLKLLIDLFLFLPTVRFFEQEKPFWKSYFVSSLVYPFFSIWVIFK